MTRIEEFRRRLGMTQTQFAAALGIQQPTLCNYERGKRRPELEVAARLIRLARKHRFDLSYEHLYEAR